MLRPRTLILVIGSNALEGVLTRGGRVIAEQIHHVDDESMRTAWESGLTSLDSALEVLCVKLGCAKGDRVIVAARPSVSGTAHREGTAGDATLERANELAAAHACTGFESHELCTQTWAWTATGAAEERRVVLSGSVPDAVLVEACAWVTRAGLRFEGFVPLQMWETERAMRAAESCGEGTVCCRIGPEYTVLVVRSPGKGTVVRAVEFGVQGLASVYARAAENRGLSGGPEEPWRLMYEHGVRWNKGRELGDVARDALPMLAPVLQRLNIELKQTLRYQVSHETETTRMRCLGIGRLVPGLAAAIATHLELALEPDPAPASEGSSRASVSREMTPEAVRSLVARAVFVPRSVRRSRRTRQLAGLAAQSGIVAAMMVLGEYKILGYEAQRSENQIAELRQTLDACETTAVIGHRLREDRNDLIDQLLALDKAFGDAPPWAAVLRVLTESDGAELSTIRFRSEENRTVVTVSGTVPEDGGDAALRAKMNAWRASGLVLSVEPTTLVRQTAGGRDTLRFTIEVELQRFPVWFHHADLAALTGTGGDRVEP